MPQPTQPNTHDEAVPSSRRPGRAFEDHQKPLGHHLVEGAAPGSLSPQIVADRAKAVSVLRKAEEFMRTDNPAPTTPERVERALELAAGRVGVTLADYHAIVRRDPELTELEREVIARSHHRH